MDIASIRLRNRTGREPTIDDITTLFDICLVVLDARRPSSYASLLPVVEHLDTALSGADCTIGVLVVGADETDATRVLGRLAGQVAVFVDPDGQAAHGLGLGGTPALVWITTAPEVGGLVEGWDPQAWQEGDRPTGSQAGLDPAPHEPGRCPGLIPTPPAERHRERGAHLIRSLLDEPLGSERGEGQ